MKNVLFILLIGLTIFLFSCSKDTYFAGVVKTADIYAVTSTTAMSGGELFIETKGEGINEISIIEAGILLSKNKDKLTDIRYADTVYNGETNSDTKFICLLSNLQNNTNYYIRSYVILKGNNNNEFISNIIYGEIKGFTTSENNEIIFALSTPTNVTAKRSGNNIVISWNAVAGAKRYCIEKSSTGLGGSYEGEMWLFPTTWIDYDPFNGTNYYRVKAQDDNGGESDWGYAQSVLQETLLAPTNVEARLTFFGSVSITWDAVEDAEQYDIYRSNTANGLYSLIGTRTTGTSISTFWEDTEPLLDNYYKIKALKGAIESDYSEYAYVDFRPTSLQPCPIQNLTISGNANTLTLNWQPYIAEYCGIPISYEVNKRNTITGEFDLLTTTTNTNYTDNNVHPGLNWYEVVATNNAGASQNVSKISDNIPISVPLGLGSGVSGNSIILQWNIVSKATGYQIFTSSSANGTYTLIDEITINTNTWTDHYPNQGMNYYKIKAKWNPPRAIPSGGVVSSLSNYTSSFY
jgi:fibronectin type 3 domain-containing protein